ncbi:hypothetical protein [Tenacibaculum ovolyticum]|uniref:hypothetical protein n=1 Tax=Tenacibaculum ovolyticum TaxID=104270 RepID=UPI0004111325|nr:hypothetical protein [Tenacibaculum ovolyticum]
MKKSILNLGKVLNKTTQKDIFGGSIFPTYEGENTCKGADDRAICHRDQTSTNNCCNSCVNIGSLGIGWCK